MFSSRHYNYSNDLNKSEEQEVRQPLEYNLNDYNHENGPLGYTDDRLYI